MLSEAEARAARVEKAETLAKLCLEEARVEAEQKLIFCSERARPLLLLEDLVLHVSH